MKQVYAEMNHARWIAICPSCAAQGITAAMEVTVGEPFICPEEHPDILATAFSPNPRMAGTFISVPDTVLREQARQAAIAAGEAYEVIFPREKKQIETLLRSRPRGARNWFQGVTLDEMTAENQARGVQHA